jgi:hypothetical protein
VKDMATMKVFHSQYGGLEDVKHIIFGSRSESYYKMSETLDNQKPIFLLITTGARSAFY